MKFLFSKIYCILMVWKLNRDIVKLERRILDIKSSVYNVSSKRLNLHYYRNKTLLSNLEFEIAEKKRINKTIQMINGEIVILDKGLTGEREVQVKSNFDETYCMVNDIGKTYIGYFVLKSRLTPKKLI